MLLRNFFFPRRSLAIFFTGFQVVSLLASEPPKPWPENPFQPLTEARIAALPEGEQAVWREYVAISRKTSAGMPKLAPEQSPTEAPKKSAGARQTRGLKHDAPAAWYASEEAMSLADRVVVWQSAAGGWTKGIDYAAEPRDGKMAGDSWSAGTFDNNATVSELRFLARVIAAVPEGEKRAGAWRGAFLRGLQYVFNAQYPNGGYPQIYPIVGGYHDAITYNDNAMGRVVELLADVADARPEFAFVSAEQRTEAARRFALGVACILKTQIVEPSGRRTVWCQQHDMLTLKPCAARNFEPSAASASESTTLVRLLMRRTAATPEVLAALDDAIAWLEKVALRDVVWDRTTLPNPSRLVPTPGAPLLWARLYEIETDKPIFGDRDRLVHYEVGELSVERQKGYGWFADWSSSTCKDYKKWREKVTTPPEAPKLK